jgi:iron complex transport system substrate-binding protein
MTDPLRRLAAALCLAACLGAAPASAAPAGKPMRVMSITLCGDQFAMMLLPPERIGSVTYLSLRQSATPALAAQARRTRINHGLAEEVLAEKPDLIVASAYVSPTTRKLAKRLGVPMVELDAADSFDDVRRQMRLLGAAFGESARAEAWIAHMDAVLAELKRTAPARPIPVVSWSSLGRVAGERSMLNEIVTAAGGVNLFAGAGTAERSLDLERLLLARPQPEALIYGVSGAIRRGEGVNLQQHPALARAYGRRRVAYPQDAVTCGTPYSADAAVALRRALLAVAAPEGGR